MKQSFLKKFIINTLFILSSMAVVNCQQGEPVYETEILSGTHKVGKSSFTFQVLDATAGEPVSGLDVNVVPWMTMATMSHGAPVGSITDNGDGTYTAVVYYLMASTNDATCNMAAGIVNGTWEIKVEVAGTEVSALPVTVTGCMEHRGLLKGGAVAATSPDQIVQMGMDIPRPYFVFIESAPSGTAPNQSLKLFIAARESLSEHPAVYPGMTLTDEASTPWTVNTVSIEVDPDGNAATVNDYQVLTSLGNGYYSASNLTLPAAGTKMHVRVLVNGVVKTTDGNDATTNTEFATLPN